MRALNAHPRLRPAGVTALEIRDLEVRGDTLFAARNEPDFAARLAEGIAAIRRGEARTRSRITLPDACRAIDAIFEGGGGFSDPIEAALLALGLPLHRGEAFVGEAGGLDLLDAVRAAMRDFGEADAIVLALPAELDDEGCPEGSSYPGLQGDRDVAAAVLERAGIPGARVIMLNDAELAALSAKRVVPPSATALVVTIGFGIGEALLLSR